MQTNLRKELIEIFSLNKDQYISGQKISEQLGCTRTAVWKHIDQLRKEGYHLEAVRNKGYKMTEVPDQLTESTIAFGLKTKVIGKHIVLKEKVTSTQKVARELVHSGAEEGTVVIADRQTDGRGRLSRAWDSPKGAGLWMSLILRPQIPIQQMPQLTLLTAVAIVQACEQVAGVNTQIKWPNDILINGKKVVGILTELEAEADQVHAVIVGIGINVNQRLEHFPDSLKETASSLLIESGQTQSRRTLLQVVLKNIEKLYDQYLLYGFKPIKLLWESYAISLNSRVKVNTLQGSFEGIATGINDEGVLLLKKDDGQVERVYSADIKIL
ncbi:biotin--[acetyl-CoA-carboxylase] ligase [Bacillus carboniphilus]|uniref:Bifunctional ligase/repressor BirA n=1 Tax=Bacillus carboniphilus TaxID=86663 RepID=A0ABY9JWE0_9BACI|nr:biotin--[acetyl-CoA-carboxylase] ligase [Bacillus carboniphilus]WLR43716.1 biotin--[acetyl-CoA-carboxylase] ligase [Bacillus carboniphilus]